MRKEIDLGHGLYKYVEVEEKSVSEQMQDELEPIVHIALARPVVNKKRSVWGDKEWHFFKGEKWEWKNDS